MCAEEASSLGHRRPLSPPQNLSPGVPEPTLPNNVLTVQSEWLGSRAARIASPLRAKSHPKATPTPKVSSNNPSGVSTSDRETGIPFAQRLDIRENLLWNKLLHESSACISDSNHSASISQVSVNSELVSRLTEQWREQEETSQRNMVNRQLDIRIDMLKREIQSEMQEATRQIAENSAAIERTRHEMRNELARCDMESTTVRNQLEEAMLHISRLAHDVAVVPRPNEEQPLDARNGDIDHQPMGAAAKESLGRLLKRIDLERQLRELAMAQEASARCDADDHLLATLQAGLRSHKERFLEEQQACETRLFEQMSTELDNLRHTILADLRHHHEETRQGLMKHVNTRFQAHCAEMGHARVAQHNPPDDAFSARRQGCTSMMDISTSGHCHTLPSQASISSNVDRARGADEAILLFARRQEHDEVPEAKVFE